MVAETVAPGAENTGGVAPPVGGALSPRRWSGRRRLALIGTPLLLAALGATLWFGGAMHALPHGHPLPPTGPQPPTFVELPEFVANLDASGHKPVYVKLQARLELVRAEDRGFATAALPRVEDLFQTYLREMHPDELRGSAGTYRLREELVARANIALAPARVADVLFTELLVQ